MPPPGVRLARVLVCASVGLLAACGADEAADLFPGDGLEADVVDGVDAGEDTATDAGDSDVGDVGGEDADPDGTEVLPDVVEVPETDPMPTRLRRLGAEQWDHIIHDVFGDDIVVPPLPEAEVNVGGLLSVGASEAGFSPRGVEALESIAFTIAEQVARSPEAWGPWFDCDGALEAGCIEAGLPTLGAQLWRRPLTTDEVDTVVGIAAAAREALESEESALEYALATLLQSPNFAWRSEMRAADDGDTFDGYSLAARLSFFLWDSVPDAELLRAAAAGELDTTEGLVAQAERMLDDPRARRGLATFVTQWLHLYELDALTKDPMLFEQYSTLLGPDAREETLRVFESFVFDEPRDYRQIMTTRRTFLNPRLAALYGLPTPNPDGFAEVLLPESTPRRGLLGHAGFLALHAHAVTSSVTLRGAAVREILLCQTIPPPPVDVDTSIPEPSGDTPTLRDRVAEHLENPACAGCHNLTDPIGLGLENYDGIGRYRDFDSSSGEPYPIDASGELDGAAFDGALELGAVIAEHRDFPRCLAQMLTRHATGQVETFSDRDAIDALATNFAARGYLVRPLILDIVASPMFRLAGAPL